MIAALLAKLVPIRDWIYLGVFVALVAGFFYYRHSLIVEGEHTEAAAVQVASNKAVAAATIQVAKLTADHEKAVTKIKEDSDAQLKTASTQHDSDAQRLREYDAYRRAHPAVQSIASGSGDQAAGNGGAVSDDARLSSLEQVGLGLATAVNTGRAALSACMAERDDLNGK